MTDDEKQVLDELSDKECYDILIGSWPGYPAIWTATDVRRIREMTRIHSPGQVAVIMMATPEMQKLPKEVRRVGIGAVKHIAMEPRN